ncbi:G2/M phase-specific E3 ubiquitin-protein ligase-like, partial [Scomber scombrus]
FRDGLRTLGVLDKIQAHQESFRPLLCWSPTTLTADLVDSLFTIRLASPVGSNRRRAEEVVVPFWRDYLTDAEVTLSAAASSSSTAEATCSGSVRTYVSGPEVLSAEVYWALDVIEKHGFFNSCTGKSELLRLMFPGSPIASKFTCGDDKAAYLTVSVRIDVMTCIL